MLKFFTFLLFSLPLCATELPINDASGVSPVRRSPAMITTQQELDLLNSGVFSERLLGLVLCYHEKKNNVKFSQIRRLISQNPANSNPYLGRYDAHLITLASRWGMLDVVATIAENYPESRLCKDKRGRTPLDEAILFGNIGVAKYLKGIDTPQMETTRDDYKSLLQSTKEGNNIFSLL